MSDRNGWAAVRALALPLMLIVFATGCAEFRGLPSHGGGKRFDEEERVVAGAIRRALADMDLKELRGKTVAVQIEAISHSGGGYATFPGIQSFSGNLGYGDNLGLTRYLPPPTPGTYTPFSDNRTHGESQNYGMGIGGSLITNYNSTTLGTDTDLNYLRSALTMKAQHCGLNVAGPTPESTLYVLVDVLGTNRSRKDSLLVWSDRLAASCELTYYAMDAKSGQLIFRARHASAEAEYREQSVLGFSAYRKDRTIASAPATPLPVDGDEVASTTAALSAQIAGAKKAVPKAAGRGIIGRLLARTEVKTAAPSLRQSLKKFLETQLANARMQLQTGNVGEAQRLVDSVRAVRPDFPGLAAVDAELAAQRQRMGAAGTVNPAPMPVAPPPPAMPGK